MKKIKDDPLFSIFKKIKDEYIEEIDSIQNIPNFFNYITSSQTPEESKIGVLDNITTIFKKNKYICEYFSSYNNKSIYLYLFDIYLSKNTSKELKSSILNLINELILTLETNNEIYEYLFQSISKIYNKEETTQEKTPENLYNHLSLLNTLLLNNEKIPKPRNFFTLSGNCKFELDLQKKKLNIGYCMTFLMNFKNAESEKSENTSTLFHIKFSNNDSIKFNLKNPGLLLIQEGNKEESKVKFIPTNEFVILVINLVVEDNCLCVYSYFNGENKLFPQKYKINLDLQKDTIEVLEFFENFYGEVTSMTMFLQKEKVNPIINSKKLLPIFKKYIEGFHKKKYVKNFFENFSDKDSYDPENLNDKISSIPKLIDNLVFIFTPFNYFHSSWERKKYNKENKVIDDYIGKYKILIKDKDDSIRNHRYQYYQKKLYLVCDITNFLPIGEIFLIHPQLLTELNLELYLQIVENIINYRKRNAEILNDNCFFQILSLFLEKYPHQIFTQKILDVLLNIGKDMFRNNFDKIANVYFKNILLNEKILSKYTQNLQIHFWDHLLLFCQSDPEQLEKFLEMNTICLILRYYDKSRYNEICCQYHLDYFKEEYKSNVMNPPMYEKLKNIWKIIDLIIDSQRPTWVLTLFKLLMLDLSPCLTNFIITGVIKALIKHNEDDNQSMFQIQGLQACKSMIFMLEENGWLKEFIKELSKTNYENIIINAFIHSMPDVRIYMLKLIYQFYQTLVILEQKSNFKIFFNMMKNYLLYKDIFYEKNGDKEILVLKDEKMKSYYMNLLKFFIFWSLDEKLIFTDNDITFKEVKKFDKSHIIKNSDIFEIVLELIKQINYEKDIIKEFLDIMLGLSKNESNCYTLLYNDKIFLMLLDFVYECYLLQLNEEKKDKEIEKCFSLGINLIVEIYLNAISYKQTNFIDTHYVLNELNLLFLWGDKNIFKNNNPKNNIVKNNVFSYISELLKELLSSFKKRYSPQLNKKPSTNNVKDNFILSYYYQNYLILLYKLFEFCYEYELDSIIKEGNIKNLLSQMDSMALTYSNIFVTSMRTKVTNEKNISEKWNDYSFFNEIYSSISYMWTKEYLYKAFDKEIIKNSNKIKKYEFIVENLIISKSQRNIFKREIEMLCSKCVKEKLYKYPEEQIELNVINSILSKEDYLCNTFIKQIQIGITSILSLIMSMGSNDDMKYWLKELKHFVIFLIIASSNLFVNEKENKDSREINASFYTNLQEECLYTIYNCLFCLYQLRLLSSIEKEKIDKTCVSIFSLCFVILKNVYIYNKKHKISKKLSIGHKYNNEDLSGSAIFNLFNNYIKDKSKEKSDNVLLTLDKLNTLLDEQNYFQNIINLLNDDNWSKSLVNEKIDEYLNEKYFFLNNYVSTVLNRLVKINEIEKESNSEENKCENSSDEVLKLLPLYEKELIHYSNNSLEMSITKKNLYKTIKKNIFSWRGYWSDKTIFYPENINKNESLNNNNDTLADKNHASKLKYKLINHYTRSLMKPLLVPILDISYYLPDFTAFNPDTLFNTQNKFIVNMDIDKIKIIKEDQKKQDEKIDLKQNYLSKIYTKSNPALADKLLKISESLDFGKEEEFSVFKEEEKEKNDSNEDKEKEKKEKNFYLSCLVKTSHHIKGVMFIDEKCLNFKVFLNQKTGNAMSGVNIGFNDKDEDYDEERKTCFGSYFMFHQKDKNFYKISIDYNDIKLILLKRYYYKNSALEIFTKTNKSYYFNFKYEDDRGLFMDKILEKLKECKTIINDYKDTKDKLNIIGYYMENKIFNDRKYNKREKIKIEKNKKKKTVKKISKIIKNWSNWKINNFKFLMWMNFFGNRSYNDISQYPIFPWILSDYNDPLKIEPIYYESSLLSLNQNYSRNVSNAENELDNEKKKKKKNMEDEYNYRDLKLPMGMLEINEESKKRIEIFRESFNSLRQNIDEFEETKPYIYGSNYSNPIYVCNFLMRLFPFTHISIELQGSKLDDPNRLFLSVNESFNNSISQKTDVRELIPEFFYLPEMFLNINDINLGKKEDNSIVYNVTTPCKNNAFSFIEILKRIFENERISKYLNYWIDLIFGYKLKGKDAENAFNVFTERSYQENIDIQNVEEKTSIFRYVEFGLIPTQVINKECPKRDKKKDVKEKEITEYTINNTNKIKVTSIKHDSSNDKNMKNSEGEKSKLLKVDILNDRFFMLYNNDTIIESKIGSSSEDINCVYNIKSFDNKVNEKYAEKQNNKIIAFCNNGMTVIIGGFYDGKIVIINLEDKIEKERMDIYPFSEEEPILSIAINNEETFMILGNSLGNIAIYQIDIENNEWELYKKIFNLMSAISDININNELNMLAISTVDGFISLYTLPLCKLVRTIKVPINEENNGKINNVFLSESSLPSIIIVLENENNSEIISYSINGTFLTSIKEDKDIICPLKIKDINSYEYLVYYSEFQIKIINLPSLSLQTIFKVIHNVTSFCLNNELTIIYTFNEDGTQIQTIRS